MAENFTPRVKLFLRENGCSFVRQGKGDDEIWHSPKQQAIYGRQSHQIATLGQLHTEAGRFT
jgi:hypothetical protein